MVHVHDKIVAVCCGSGSQRLQWLGHVGIARYDASNEQGWMQFGRPVAIRNAKGDALAMTDIVCEVLVDKEHIYVDTSRTP
ncbi:hypothetical protein DYB38_003254 [Aphanomyces astaci]|uniref:Par3/HAL N-terminal domain-containing protein n=1 Tax=Aphanomyces astaci TaxID=112090 RepID=A0A397BZA3_APHAT|nr:hypothetical protein DYB36_007668 [Aphanomyces astaci]RHY37142.1 hypothetical protein DYB38_003254 [Aphanomyces astaci]RHZ30518.1 hypothetical protein DYB31_007450 [Aphanomyces astaci]